MKNQQSSRNGAIHLYNPKKEGLSGYDINYINAYKKNKMKGYKESKRNNERSVA